MLIGVSIEKNMTLGFSNPIMFCYILTLGVPKYLQTSQYGGFLKIGIPPAIIHFGLLFSLIKHLTMGVPP